MLAANRQYLWDQSLQWEAVRLGAEPDEIIDSVDAFIALGKISVSDVAGFLMRLDPVDRPLAAKVMESRGTIPVATIRAAVSQAGTKKKKFPTKAVAVGAGIVGLLVVGMLVLR